MCESSKKESRRSSRVSDLVRAELSLLVLTEAHDPELKRVTITDVEMPPDLRSARVYFSCLGGEEEREKALQALKRAAGFLRREVRPALRPPLRAGAEVPVRPLPRARRAHRGDPPPGAARERPTRPRRKARRRRRRARSAGTKARRRRRRRARSAGTKARHRRRAGTSIDPGGLAQARVPLSHRQAGGPHLPRRRRARAQGDGVRRASGTAGRSTRWRRAFFSSAPAARRASRAFSRGWTSPTRA